MLITKPTDKNKSHSAGSSSNVSSSNSNNSDHGFNSLDSMENDMQPATNALKSSPLRNRKKLIPATTSKAAALITSSDSMSYLGPFNFRQLLRPVQGQRTSPQHKRKTIITVRNGAV